MLLAFVLCACGGIAPRPEVKVVEAHEVEVLPQSPLIIGRDGGDSALLWGHSVWAFGDTVLSVPDVDGVTWHHNSFTASDDLDGEDGVTWLPERLDGAGAPRYLIAPTAEEEAFNAAHRGDPCAEPPCGARWAAWPGAPVFDEARSRALIPYGLIYAEPGDFNFHGVGQSFAVWTDYAALPERPVVDPAQDHPTLLFLENEPGYGDGGSAIVGDALYAFACRPNCKLGKVPLDHVFERAAWTYWDGAAWSAQIGDARALFDAPYARVGYNDYLRRWTAVYAEDLSDHVVMRTAPDLTGPWSAPAGLFTADRKGTGGWTYDAYPHAEYAGEGGRVQFVSFTRSNGQGWFGSELVWVRVLIEPAPHP